mmetsp:Transcript_19588/g.38074  ORF Transcript_19588/g.38074 Transcript_19588/m.38074 type:complete len:320 (+) Transcript_19588:60-1019(+)
MSYRPHKRLKGTRLEDMCVAKIAQNLDKVWVDGKSKTTRGRELVLRLDLKRKVLEHLRGDPVMPPLPAGFLDEEWAEGGVDLSMCELPDGLLEQVGREVPSLKSINLKQCSGIDMLKPRGFVEMCEGCRQLRSIDLIGVMTMTDEMLQAMHKLCASLRVVRMGGCVCLTTEALAAFIKHAGQNLLELDLSGCQVNDHVMREIVTHCKNLTNLGLAYCDDVSHMAWCMLFRTLKGIKVLRLARVTGLSDALVLLVAKHMGDSVEDLDIAGCQLVTDESITYLVHRAPKLRTFSIRYCIKISDTMAERIPGIINGITLLTK